MKIKGVFAAIKKGGLIPYSKSIYRKKKKELTKKLLENSKILMIDLNSPVQEINKKLREVKQEFVAFYDTEAVFDEGYFEGLRDELKKNPEIGCATGNINDKTGKPLAHFGEITEEIFLYDVTEEVAGAPLFLGTLCRSHIIKNNGLLFNEKLKYCKPELFATGYLEISPRGLVVSKLN